MPEIPKQTYFKLPNEQSKDFCSKLNTQRGNPKKEQGNQRATTKWRWAGYTARPDWLGGT